MATYRHFCGNLHGFLLIALVIDWPHGAFEAPLMSYKEPYDEK